MYVSMEYLYTVHAQLLLLLICWTYTRTYFQLNSVDSTRMCMSGVSVSNDLMNMLTIFCLLLHDDIIDWRYFAWRYFAGDIFSVHRTVYTIHYTVYSNYTLYSERWVTVEDNNENANEQIGELIIREALLVRIAITCTQKSMWKHYFISFHAEQ